MAEKIPGAQLVELEGRDYPPWVGDADAVLGEIEEFLTGTRAGHAPDRIIATVLFTDIVGSTERPHCLETKLGGSYSSATTLSRVSRSRVLGAAWSSRRATVCWRPSRTPPPRSGPRRPSAPAAGDLDLEVTAGVHTGQCELIGADVGGIAVHIGARVAALAEPGEVLVSSTVRDLLVGSDLQFDDRGVHALKGIPGEWRLYAAGAPTPART
jgi:class 3 adenylate cyclase